jgi:hypothetical protein
VPIKYGMDKKQFRNKLEEIAIIKDRKPVRTPQHHRWAKEKVIEIDELTGEEIEVEKEITENPTLGIELVRIKEIVKLCELGCGKVVADQVIEKRYCFSPERHWRTKCQNCGSYVSPDGTGLLIGSQNVSNAFVKHFNHIRMAQQSPDFSPETSKENK